MRALIHDGSPFSLSRCPTRKCETVRLPMTRHRWPTVSDGSHRRRSSGVRRDAHRALATHFVTTDSVHRRASRSMPDHIHPDALWWALAPGADFGGNLTAVGTSANVVMIGIARGAGHPISFGSSPARAHWSQRCRSACPRLPLAPILRLGPGRRKPMSVAAGAPAVPQHRKCSCRAAEVSTPRREQCDATLAMLDLNAAMGEFATSDTGRLITDALTQYRGDKEGSR